jgi:hypothetical protein
MVYKGQQVGSQQRPQQMRLRVLELDVSVRDQAGNEYVYGSTGHVSGDTFDLA